MKAVVTQGSGQISVEELPIPQPGPKEIVIKVVAASINPADRKYVEGAKAGNIVGCDFAGYVEAAGPDVPVSLVQLGQLRAGFVRGSVNPNRGGFAEFVAIDWELTAPVPDRLGPQAASTLPLSLGTAVLAINHALGISMPPVPYPSGRPQESTAWMLVWSGASATGQMAIQIARLCGLQVVATSSPKQFDKLKSLGAELVYDYNDPDAPEKIVKATNGRVTVGLDGFSTFDSARQCERAFGDQGGRLVSLLGDIQGLTRSDVELVPILAYNVLGEDGSLGDLEFKTTPAMRNLFSAWQTGLVFDLLDRGLLKPFEYIEAGGIMDVAKAFDLQESEASNGKKVVIRIPA